jgi:phosphoglycerate dehydrogenase-like enzyme
MGLLKFLDTAEIEEFATTLATDLERRFPPASEKRTDPGAKQQLKVILDGLAARAVRFHVERKLGIYGKAKLGNVFRWRLQEFGYSKAFCERATKEIITRLAIKKGV